MSILRVAVETHLAKTKLSLRELLETAYYRRYEKPMPIRTLDEDVRRWENGENNIPYLYDFVLQTCGQ